MCLRTSAISGLFYFGIGVAAVLTLLWRNVAGVTELTRMLARDGFLSCGPTAVSQQAVSQRFLIVPQELFESVFKQLLPELRKAWFGRNAIA